MLPCHSTGSDRPWLLPHALPSRLCSQAYADYMGFILTLNEGVRGKKLTCDYKVSEVGGEFGSTHFSLLFFFSAFSVFFFLVSTIFFRSKERIGSQGDEMWLCCAWGCKMSACGAPSRMQRLCVCLWGRKRSELQADGSCWWKEDAEGPCFVPAFAVWLQPGVFWYSLLAAARRLRCLLCSCFSCCQRGSCVTLSKAFFLSLGFLAAQAVLPVPISAHTMAEQREVWLCVSSGCAQLDLHPQVPCSGL